MNKRPLKEISQELGNAYANLGFLSHSISKFEKSTRKLQNDLLGAHKRCQELEQEHEDAAQQAPITPEAPLETV